jgi:hypothetical protein
MHYGNLAHAMLQLLALSPEASALSRQRTSFRQAGWCGAASTASVAFLSNLEVSRQLGKGPASSVSVNADSTGHVASLS